MRRATLPLLVACLAAPAADAYQLSGTYWPDTAFPLVWKLDADGVDNISGTGDNDEVERAARAWNDISCSKVRFAAADRTLQPAAFAEAGSDGNKVYWVESGWRYGSGTLGVTTPKYYTPGNNIFDADIVFNGADYNWNAAPNGCRNCTDVFSIALHEMGHFFGLNHSAQSSAVMYASYPGDSKQQLSDDDIRGACDLYPDNTVPGSVPQGGTCIQQSDCVSGLSCTRSTQMTSSICTKTCTTQAPTCPTQLDCQDSTVAGVKACLPTINALGDLCKPCSRGQDCASGICVNAGTFSVCSRTCGAQSGCPTTPNYGCFQSQGTSTPFCFPQSNSCPNNCGSGCPAGQFCDATAAGGPSCRFTVPGDGEDCTDTGNCQTGFFCVTEDEITYVCRKQCTPGGAIVCKTGEACFSLGGTNGGACFPDDTPPVPGRQGEACAQQKPCATGLWCLAPAGGDTICVADCSPSGDNCSSNLKCNAWNPKPAGVGTTQGGYCYGTKPPPPKAQLCETCGGTVTCAAGLFCVSGTSGPSCRPGCTQNDQCAGGSCETRAGIPGFTGVCRCGGAPKEEGDACTADAQCPTGNICIREPNGTPVCRKRCDASAADCPSDRTCKTIGTASVCSVSGGSTDGGTTDGGGDDTRTGPCGNCASVDPASLVLFAGVLVGATRRRRSRG